jgi:hypothetical protein
LNPNHRSADFTIASEVWLDALGTVQRVAKLVRATPSEAVIEFGANQLKLYYAGSCVEVPATGQGNGRLSFAGSYIKPLATVVGFMGPESIRLWASGEELHIGTTAIRCRWLDGAPPAIRLPLNANLRDILRLRYLHCHEDITAAGLAECLFEAESRKAELVQRAYEALEPLGISLPALDRFVRACLTEESPKNGKTGQTSGT